MHDLESRTGPGSRPDSDIAALRALRKATRDYMVVLEAFQKALGETNALAGRPDLVYLKVALQVATGERGSAFGTAAGLERMLTHMPGESEEA